MIDKHILLVEDDESLQKLIKKLVCMANLFGQIYQAILNF